MSKLVFNKINKIILAYSGGLDTSVIIPWLIETYGCEVIAYAADLVLTCGTAAAFIGKRIERVESRSS